MLGKFNRKRPPEPEPTAPDQLEIIGSAVDELKNHLADIADDNDALLTGVLQPLALDDVRAALGDQWPALSAQVLSFATRHIEHLLGPDDSVRRHGETGFLIRFSGLGKDAGTLHAARLALRLKAALIGQFPQLIGGGEAAAQPGEPASRRAHEVMSQFEIFAERRRQARAVAEATDPRLWRSALGQAMCELLEAGKPISTEALIGQLQTRLGTNDLILKAASIEAAIARLEQVSASRPEPENPPLAAAN